MTFPVTREFAQGSRWYPGTTPSTRRVKKRFVNRKYRRAMREQLHELTLDANSILEERRELEEKVEEMPIPYVVEPTYWDGDDVDFYEYYVDIEAEHEIRREIEKLEKSTRTLDDLTIDPTPPLILGEFGTLG